MRFIISRISEFTLNGLTDKEQLKDQTVLIIGGGVIGLCVAYYSLLAGKKVILVEKGPKDGDNCSAENAGMVVPSHFVPLAAPGMISLGLRWMLNPESPFQYVFDPMPLY